MASPSRNPITDVIRMFAVIAMIANHWVVRAIGPAQESAWDRIFLLGSFAPVLFFFVTGLGYGLRRGLVESRFDTFRLIDSAIKCTLLIAADAMLWLSPGSGLHLDFLAFIAITSAAIIVIDASPRSTLCALIFALTSLFLRFVIARGDPETMSVWPNLWKWTIGQPAVDGISYPLSPWIVFGLSGYVLGVHWPLYSRKYGSAVLIAIGVVGGVVCEFAAMWLAERGMSFHRWGTMSLTYFIASVGAVAIVTSLAIAICTLHQRAIRCFSISSISSFAAVPIHYAVILLLIGLIEPSTTSPCLSTGLAIVAAVLLSEVAALGLQQLARILAAWTWVTGGLIVTSSLVILATVSLNLGNRTLVACTGQLAVVMLMSCRLTRQSASRELSTIPTVTSLSLQLTSADASLDTPVG